MLGGDLWVGQAEMRRKDRTESRVRERRAGKTGPKTRGEDEGGSHQQRDTGNPQRRRKIYAVEAICVGSWRSG